MRVSRLTNGYNSQLACSTLHVPLIHGGEGFSLDLKLTPLWLVRSACTCSPCVMDRVKGRDRTGRTGWTDGTGHVGRDRTGRTGWTDRGRTGPRQTRHVGFCLFFVRHGSCDGQDRTDRFPFRAYWTGRTDEMDGRDRTGQDGCLSSCHVRPSTIVKIN